MNKPVPADDQKPIVIITTVYPAKGSKRRVMVSAAPEGEMPITLSGLFAERHQLSDKAFGQLLQRKPQTVKVAGKAKAAASKSKPKTKSKSAGKKRDQLVASDDTPEPEVIAESRDEDLPVIEGDDEPEQLELLEA